MFISRNLFNGRTVQGESDGLPGRLTTESGFHQNSANVEKKFLTRMSNGFVGSSALAVSVGGFIASLLIV